MLQQLSEATLSLLLTMLAVGATIRLVPAAGRGRSGRRARALAVWGGIGVGAAASLALTVVATVAPKSLNRQSIGLVTLPVAVVAAAALIALFLRRARVEWKRRAERLVRASGADPADPLSGDGALRAVAALYIAFALFRALPTAMTQGVMMLSGGVELYSTTAVMAITGYALAWVLCAVLGWLSHRLCSLSARVWPAVLVITSLGLAHILMIVRVLKAKRLISLPADVFSAVSWLINHEAVFTLAAAAVLGAVTVITWWASRSIPREGANPAEGRLARARARLYKAMAGSAAIGYLCGALLITVGVAIGSQEVELSAPESYSVVDDHATIELSAVSDGHLHRYEYTTSTGVKVRFIVIQKSGSSFGVGLDACEICGPTGYYEKDGKVICKLCEVAMNIATIGFKGGCNPIPIEYEVGNGTLTVPVSALEAAAPVFAK